MSSEKPITKPGVRKFTADEVKEIVEAYIEFVETEDDPLLASFLAMVPIRGKYWVSEGDMYSHKELREWEKKAIQKQEAYLVQQGLNNKINTAMAIFRLKQPKYGYRDRFDYDVSSQGEKLTFVNTLPRPGKKPTKS